MFVPEEINSEFCFARTDVVPAGSRLFAAETPLETAR